MVNDPLVRPRTRGFTLIEVLIACAVFVIVLTIAVPLYQRSVDSAKEIAAVSDLREISQAIDLYVLRNDVPPASLAEVGLDHMRDPWGRPYQYLRLSQPESAPQPTQGQGQGKGKGKEPGTDQGGGVGKARKDHNLVPINTDYDLYSLGADGMSASPLTAAVSRDDIVRAQNGIFFGLASEY